MHTSHSFLCGAVAGAAGTVALNIATYADMTARGRPASETPAELVKRVASSADVAALTADDAPAKNRRSGLGALLGYVNGIGLGAAYGTFRPLLPDRMPVAASGLAVGLIAMLLSDVPAAKTGATDPAAWTPADWLADLVPHALYGVALVLAYDALEPARD